MNMAVLYLHPSAGSYVMIEHERVISAYKEYLPAKCLQSDHPQILWIEAPLHDDFPDNAIRSRFNACLEEVAKLHSNVRSLPLKKVWNARDTSFYLADAVNPRLTLAGFQAYWEAID